MNDTRYQSAIEAIDRANAEDPRTVEVDGAAVPYEQHYARRLAEWVSRLNPDASEALRLAAHGQHIRRWTIPRDRFPEGLNGYLEWRETLKAFHADEMSSILREAGYEQDMIDRVLALVRKDHFPDDPESRVLEDALCLVFLEFQLPEFAEEHPDEKVIDILQKTWAKMTDTARRIALDMEHPPAIRRLVERATKA